MPSIRSHNETTLMKYNKLTKLQKALEQEAESKKVVIPVDFFQRGIHGDSFREGGIYEERIDKLAEIYTATLLGAAHKPCKEFDVLERSGETVEVKFRTMSEPTATVTANVACVSRVEVQDKTADRLFFWVYNPTTCLVDLFVIPKEVYLPKGYTIRYSPSKGEYTESGGAKYRVDPEKYAPELVQVIHMAEQAKKGVKFTIQGCSDDEAVKFVRQLINASTSGLLQTI